MAIEDTRKVLIEFEGESVGWVLSNDPNTPCLLLSAKSTGGTRNGLYLHKTTASIWMMWGKRLRSSGYRKYKQENENFYYWTSIFAVLVPKFEVKIDDMSIRYLSLSFRIRLFSDIVQCPVNQILWLMPLSLTSKECAPTEAVVRCNFVCWMKRRWS